ncbi:MAG: type II toxin-antitoxin system VapB family antitoxin [Dehalococcoidia bacterium]|nr:type II toxin-antitoxin system VapB family antitoxin [Dehalococcoidia bacterium]
MIITIDIDDGILRRASELAGIEDETRLVRLGLEALIAQESSRRLANLGGTEKHLRPVQRRKQAGN